MGERPALMELQALNRKLEHENSHKKLLKRIEELELENSKMSSVIGGLEKELEV